MHEGPDNALEDAFDDGDDSDDGGEADDRQRLMRGDPAATNAGSVISPESNNNEASQPSSTERRVTVLPTFPSPINPRLVGTGSSNDGVFANLNAKPERAEKQQEDLPPVCDLLYMLIFDLL